MIVKKKEYKWISKFRVGKQIRIRNISSTINKIVRINNENAYKVYVCDGYYYVCSSNYYRFEIL